MKNDKIQNNLPWLWFLSIIYPFLAFVFAVKYFDVKKFRIFIFLFAVFYGITFIPTEGSDAIRYEERIATLESYSFSKYKNDIATMYDLDAQYNDAYIYTVFFVVSKFSTSLLVYRIVFAGIYFYVLLLLLFTIYDYVNIHKKYKIVIWFLLGFLFLINISSGINGIRWPLGLQLFLLGLFKYAFYQKPKYLLICVSAFFVHYAIGFLLLFLLVYVITKNFYNPIYVFVLVGVLFIATSGGSINNSISFAGEGIDKKTSGYTTNEDYKEQRNEHLESLNWYIQFNRYSTYYFGLICLVLIILFRKKIYKDQTALNLEYIVLLMYIASFISGQLVDELSNRYYLVANAGFLTYMFYLTSMNNILLLKRLTFIYIPIGLLHIFIMLRGDQTTISPNLFFGNLFTEYIYNL